jgi:hypothetical protein
MDDFVINVRQIAQYLNKMVVGTTDLVLLQESDPTHQAAGAYRNASAADLLTSILQQIVVPEISASTMDIQGEPVATEAFIRSLLQTSVVRTFMHRNGDIFLTENDILLGGGAPQNNAHLFGRCTAPISANPQLNDDTIATAAWVQSVLWFWTQSFLRPKQTMVVMAGPYNATPMDAVILVNIGGLVTINLPEVLSWIQCQFPNKIELVIKDLGGNAGTFPINIIPNFAQKIDLLPGGLSLNTNYQSISLRPLDDLTGWYALAGGSESSVLRSNLTTDDGVPLITDAGDNIVT